MRASAALASRFSSASMPSSLSESSPPAPRSVSVSSSRSACMLAMLASMLPTPSIDAESWSSQSRIEGSSDCERALGERAAPAPTPPLFLKRDETAIGGPLSMAAACVTDWPQTSTNPFVDIFPFRDVP